VGPLFRPIVGPCDAAAAKILWPLVPLEANKSGGAESRVACLGSSGREGQRLRARGRNGRVAFVAGALDALPRIDSQALQLPVRPYDGYQEQPGVRPAHHLPGTPGDIDGVVGLPGNATTLPQVFVNL